MAAWSRECEECGGMEHPSFRGITLTSTPQPWSPPPPFAPSTLETPQNPPPAGPQSAHRPAGQQQSPTITTTPTDPNLLNPRNPPEPTACWSSVSSSSCRTAAKPTGKGPKGPPPPREAALQGCPHCRHSARASLTRPAEAGFGVWVSGFGIQVRAKVGVRSWSTLNEEKRA